VTAGAAERSNSWATMGRMRMRVLGPGWFSAVGIVLSAGSASATPFVQMDRQDSESRAGADLTYHLLNNDGPNSATLLRFEAHGQYVDPASGAGGYLQMPIAFLTGDGDSVTSVGNLELGGIFVIPGETKIVLHGGIALPTSREESDDAFVGVVAGYLRPHDLYATLPKTTTARLGVSPIFRSGKAVARIDVGLDINVDGPNDNSDVEPALHINVGGGYMVSPTASINAELITMTIIGEDINGDTDSETVSVAALSARFWTGGFTPYAALLLPLDNEISAFIDAGLLIGAEGQL